MQGRFQIALEYPVHAQPRWGHGKPMHAELERRIAQGRERYADLLRGVLRLREDLARIARQPDPADPVAPAWVNGFFAGLDSALLYALLRMHAPRRYVEIGSGHSTRLAYRAITDGGISTRIASIDPSPRAEVESICDEAIRQPLEAMTPTPFEDLEAGDVLFLDGSHRAFTNSDAVVFFLEILPRLAPGVLVHVHDVFLPADYPAEWADRYYSEQYLLACWLLADPGRLEVVFPAAWICWQPELAGILEPLWSDPRMQGVQRDGCSFWLRTG